MKSRTVSISTIKEAENNPRFIRDEKYKKLVSSLEDFKQMLELRPIVVADNVVLGGNMRFRAAKELGIKKIEVLDVSELTEDQRKEFMIKDNMSYGKWDYDKLANEWENKELNEWGVDVWQEEEDVEMDLDEIGVPEIGSMQKEVVSALQIKFSDEDFEQAKELVKKWNDAGKEIGGPFIKAMEKTKNSMV